MQTKQIAFCSAIASASEEAASQLLSEQQDNKDFLIYPDKYGHNPALFALWAATQNYSQQPKKILAKLFTDQLSAENTLFVSSEQTIFQVVEKLIFPYVKSTFLPILKDIGLRSASPTIHPGNCHYYLFAYEALGLILTHKAFDEIGPHLRDFARKIYDSGVTAAMLIAKNHLDKDESPEAKEKVPESIKHLIFADKNEKRPAISSLHHFTEITQVYSDCRTDEDKSDEALFAQPKPFLSSIALARPRSFFSRGSLVEETISPQGCYKRPQ